MMLTMMIAMMLMIKTVTIINYYPDITQWSKASDFQTEGHGFETRKPHYAGLL